MTFDKIKELWPIILFILGLTVAGAQASTKLENHQARIERLETAPERLARMEGMIETQGKQLSDIQRKLDSR